MEGGQGSLLLSSPHSEQVQLTLQISLPTGGDAVQHLPKDLHQLGAPAAHPVEGAGLDQALQHPPVQVPVEHPVAEVHKVCKGSVLAPFLQQAVDHVPAHPFQGHQAEADPPI